MNNATIEIKDLSVRYADVEPIRDLSLCVRGGEFLSLLGPSGCGKTTTLRAVAGFSNVSDGDIKIGGVSVRNIPANRRNIGMVYQDYALFPHMTVRKNIGFGMKMRGVQGADDRITEVADQLQLSGLLDRYPGQLSGGQQQRVALARAIVIKPSVLLLDEPMAALDRQLRSDMQFELRKLQKAVGITTLFVTHDQEEALSLSDRIAVMNGGKILQIDTPDRVYRYPSSLFVAEFIGIANLIPASIVEGARGLEIALTGLGLSIACQEKRRPGSVNMMLRPEHIFFSEAAGDTTAHAVLKAKVQNAVFVGSTIKYQVGIETGQTLRVDAPASGARVCGVGDVVSIGWRADDMRVFRDGVLEQ
ncbi:MAG: ABC transporter ATP-binding protein [Xanthobacteraceae bacterium]